MKRLIYDLYYADKITQEVAMKLLDKWSENYNKRKYQNMKKYHVQNYIRWKEDMAAAIKRLPDKPYCELSRDELITCQYKYLLS